MTDLPRTRIPSGRHYEMVTHEYVRRSAESAPVQTELSTEGFISRKLTAIVRALRHGLGFDSLVKDDTQK